MSARPAKTAADYMAMAACPVLIMVLVGSLVFFLVQIGYAGDSLGRLRWTLFWFVFAMVLVSRIAIEQSRGAAFLYGLALAAATSLMLTRYLGFLWGVWLLLGLIWWASNKIVWDCTLIDDDQDASGEGLLRMSRIPRRQQAARQRVRAVPQDAASDRPDGSDSSDKSERLDKKRQPHSPGLWVLYFSFAAVPVFGFGELLLAPGDAAGKRFCFLLLFAYLGSALGLLLLTSFLGLRRYLRQRHLVMPARIASSWVTTGAGLAVVVLLLAVLLPRPNTPYSVAAFVTKLTTPKPGSGDNKSGDGADRQPAQPHRTDSGQTAGESQDQAASQPQNGSKTGGNSSVPSAPSVPDAAMRAAKWLPYAVAAVVLFIMFVRFLPEISAGFNLLLARAKQPRNKKKRTTPGAFGLDAQAITLLPDPYQSGKEGRMPLPDLVLYTFEGLRRWAGSRGFELDPSETPIEFAERLSTREPVLAHEIRLVSRYVSHLAYAAQVPDEEALQVLKRLWSVIGFRRGS